ncbi:MAG: hypothetical protein UU71_C0007G0030 [Parcubacteria group bacterium GW2011_GWB1_41_6]|nr:MAG: hypothetical protein UU71_C0007G0030 [Parcubacteria group bacterium GW2011_GWB1_41_6]KKS34299.1 MAG: hypothetical protein UU96_C0006G0037 [Parcubacteria group bacterium GW2011_GWC2_42_13]
MNAKKKIPLMLLRLALGWMMLYAGLSKILAPQWTSKGYMAGAKILPEFFNWLALPNIMPITDFLNQWGLTLIGLSLLLGFFVRISSVFGLALMILYYLPLIDPALFPKIEHSYVVDEHIIYALVFLVLAVFNAGKAWGIDSYRK